MIATYICSSEGTGGGIPRQTVISLDGAGCIFVVQLIAVVPVEVKRYAEAGGHGLVPGNLFGRNSSCQEHLGSELSARGADCLGSRMLGTPCSGVLLGVEKGIRLLTGHIIRGLTFCRYGAVIAQRRDCGIQLLLPVIDNAHGAGTIKR